MTWNEMLAHWKSGLPGSAQSAIIFVLSPNNTPEKQEKSVTLKTSSLLMGNHSNETDKWQ